MSSRAARPRGHSTPRHLKEVMGSNIGRNGGRPESLDEGPSWVSHGISRLMHISVNRMMGLPQTSKNSSWCDAADLVEYKYSGSLALILFTACRYTTAARINSKSVLWTSAIVQTANLASLTHRVTFAGERLVMLCPAQTTAGFIQLCSMHLQQQRTKRPHRVHLRHARSNTPSSQLLSA